MEKNLMPIDREKYIELPLMTVAETARYMGVGRKIVYQLIEYGEIRAVKNKSRVEIEKASVDAFRAAGRLT
jgi:excisionase family DNA binding protein